MINISIAVINHHFSPKMYTHIHWESRGVVERQTDRMV